MMKLVAVCAAVVSTALVKEDDSNYDVGMSLLQIGGDNNDNTGSVIIQGADDRPLLHNDLMNPGHPDYRPPINPPEPDSGCAAFWAYVKKYPKQVAALAALCVVCIVTIATLLAEDSSNGGGSDNDTSPTQPPPPTSPTQPPPTVPPTYWPPTPPPTVQPSSVIGSLFPDVCFTPDQPANMDQLCRSWDLFKGGKDAWDEESFCADYDHSLNPYPNKDLILEYLLEYFTLVYGDDHGCQYQRRPFSDDDFLCCRQWSKPDTFNVCASDPIADFCLHSLNGPNIRTVCDDYCQDSPEGRAYACSPEVGIREFCMRYPNLHYNPNVEFLPPDIPGGEMNSVCPFGCCFHDWPYGPEDFDGKLKICVERMCDPFCPFITEKVNCPALPKERPNLYPDMPEGWGPKRACDDYARCGYCDVTEEFCLNLSGGPDTSCVKVGGTCQATPGAPPGTFCLLQTTPPGCRALEIDRPCPST